MRLRLNLYRGNGAEKLSTEDAKQGKESYASSVARGAGSPVTVLDNITVLGSTHLSLYKL
jgi:hypothetical protein